jgi:hypothetical protein
MSFENGETAVSSSPRGLGDRDAGAGEVVDVAGGEQRTVAPADRGDQPCQFRLTDRDVSLY